MLSITEFPKSLLAGVRTEFDSGRESYTPVADQFVQAVDSTLLTESYVFTGQHKGPRLFEGEVIYGKLAEYNYQLTNKPYFDAMEIDQRLIKYEQTGRIQQKSRDFGYEWSRGIDKQAIETLYTGASVNCYDGTPYFGASHVDLDSGVQSNIQTGVTTLGEAELQQMIGAFAGYKDDRGEIMGRRLTHILVRTGSDYDTDARQLANSIYTVNTAVGEGAANVFQGRFEVIDTPYLPDSVAYIGMDLSVGSNRPVIRQLSGELMFTAQERDSHVFQNYRVYRYAVHQDWAHGYNDWRLGYMALAA